VRWQWPARIVVAAIGLGAAVAIVVYSHRQARPPEPLTKLQNINPDVVTKGGAGVTQFLKAGKNPVTVNSNGSEEDKTGRKFFTGVLIEGLEENRFTIKGDRLNLDGPEDHPSSFNLSGHVVITTNDGLSMDTDTATYDDATGSLNLPRNLTYAKGRISGSALAGSYDRNRNEWTLLGDATAHVHADSTGRGAADASATRMVLVRDQHRLDLDQRARIVGDTQVLTSDTAVMTFTDDESAIKALDLNGTAHVTPKAGAPGAADQPEMSAETIGMTFRPDGVTLQRALLAGHARLALAGASGRSIEAAAIDASMAPDGHTLVGLKATDHVDVELAATETSRARTITSEKLEATGDDTKGLTSARFDGSPIFTEQPEPSKTPNATPAKPLRGFGVTLVLKLGGQIDAIEMAEFQQKAKFESADATAYGDIARYDQAHDVVHFQPNDREPRQRPSVQNPDMKVDAWSIDMNTSTQDLRATGEVTTRSQPQASAPAGRPAAGLFDAGDVVLGTADSLDYKKSTGVATYKGSKARAKLWQGKSSIVADEIGYTDTTRYLTASGHVRSVWLLDATPSAKPPAGRGGATDTQYTVDAENLIYDDAARVATFKAPEVTLMMKDDEEIRAAVLTLRLAAEERALEELHADGRAWAHLSGGYEAVSDTLVYDAPKDIYELRSRPGNLAQAKKPNDETKPADPSKPAAPPQCTVDSGQHIVINRKEGTVVQPGVSQAARTTTSQPCSVPLKRGGK
jgi:lipopolysaccharide export system protein LptA